MVIHEPTLESDNHRNAGYGRRHSENIVKKFNPSYVYYGFYRLFH